MKRMLAALLSATIAFVAFTWWALEWSDVATLGTQAEDGTIRSTHVWFAEPDGELWLEAGTPENPWYVDVQRDPAVSFQLDGSSSEHVAQTIPGAVAHDRIRALLRQKYGLRDRWIALVFDTSRSVAVRLVPASARAR